MFQKPLKRAYEQNPEAVKKWLDEITERQDAENLKLKYRNINQRQFLELKKSIETNYHTGWRSRNNYSADEYAKDLDDHLCNRLKKNRELIIPWLDTIRPLNGLRILEIGCGTGASTLALAEQGATVIGIDIDEGAIAVARDRMRLHGVKAELHTMGGTQIGSSFEFDSFDLILFFACLEHMTLSERLDALSKAWMMLSIGGMLGVVETPNRLWYYDHHTSLLPFYHWLPDELAFRYSRFSPRENFHEIYSDLTSPEREHFLRRGRGVSFHEFDLAIKPVNFFSNVNSLSSFIENNKLYKRNRSEFFYMQFLHDKCPQVPLPFFEKEINLVINKE